MSLSTTLHDDVFLDAFDAAGIGRWSWIFATNEIRWSPALEKLHGLAEGEFDGKFSTFIEIVHPEDRDGLQRDIKEAVRTRKPFRRELRILGRGGDVRWLESHGHVAVDDAGEPYAMLGLAIDISERKTTASDLAASEDRFRTLIDAQLLGIGTWTTDGVMETANDTLLTMLGMTRDEFEKRPLSWMDITAPGYETVDAEALRQVRIEGRCQPFEKEYVRRDGTRFPVLIAISLFPADPGKGVSYVIDLSAQKRRTEAKFRRLFESNIFGMAIVSSNGRIVDANDSFLALVGHPRSALDRGELTRMSLLSPQYRKREESALQELENDGTCAPYEKEILRADGQKIPVLAAAAELQGERREHIELVIDLTEQKRMQRSLLEAEERFRVAASSASDLIYEWDVHSGTMRWYGDVQRHLGYAEEEFLQTFDGWKSVIHPDDLKRVLAAIDRHLMTRAPFQEEYRVLKRDGSVAYWADRAALLYGADGEPWRWIGVSSNVTALRLGALALAESENRFRKLTERVRVIPWEADARTGHFTYVGPQSADILGFPTEQWYEPDFWPEHIHEEDRSWAVSYCINRSKVLDDYEFEYRMTTADGRVVWLYDIVNVVRENGEPRYLRGFMIDIDDRKKADEERQAALVREREARKHAEDASRAKDEFLATVSHELRTPLTSILGWSQMLRGGAASTPELQQRAYAAIERNARAQAQLIDDILDVARIVTGKIRLDLRPIDLVPLVQSAIDSVRPGADAKGVRISTEVQLPLPLIQGDPDRLQQILWNLLSNAIKFTDSEGSVSLHISRDVDELCIRVVDTGMGISPDFLPHVFEPFRQADGTSRRSHAGLGLGLSIVRHLAQMHGGTVRAESEGEQRGSTFTLTIPFLIPEGTPLALPLPSRRTLESEPAAALSAQALSNLTILVVDDESDVRQLLTNMLERFGAKVAAARSTDEAINFLNGTTFDLLLSDIGMPGEDGYGLMTRIRESSAGYANIPAIALTAYARQEDRDRALAAGFHEHLAKPVDLVALMEAVGRVSRVATKN